MELIHNLFTDKEVEEIKNNISQVSTFKEQKELGRVNIPGVVVPPSVRNKILLMVEQHLDNPEIDDKAIVVTYSNKFGQPDLPPHYDGDPTDIILDYQLASNTRWDIGADTQTFELFDNSALLFNPNKHAHWRPHKQFQDNEYVTMVFFRFFNSKGLSDYSHLRLGKDDPAFDEANAYRNSLS